MTANFVPKFIFHFPPKQPPKHGNSLSRLQNWWCIRSTARRVGTQRWQNLTFHPDFKISAQGRKTERNDYDIAILRLDYPIMDEGTGITVLQVFKSLFPLLSSQGNKFDKATLMPICLPKNKG